MLCQTQKNYKTKAVMVQSDLTDLDKTQPVNQKAFGQGYKFVKDQSAGS
ncbi:UNVERIFIED_CONTAM: hypothetical protein H355_004606, partial [Colinus virginianus]